MCPVSKDLFSQQESLQLVNLMLESNICIRNASLKILLKSSAVAALFVSKNVRGEAKTSLDYAGGPSLLPL